MALQLRASILNAMRPLRAHVQNGRLILEEPTDLPEGQAIDLVPLDEVLANGGDYLDENDRVRLHESIGRGLEDVSAGRTVTAEELISKLKKRAAKP